MGNTKTTATEPEVTLPHNGRLLQDYFLKNEINLSKLARKIGRTAPSVYHYVDSPSLQMSILWNISLALKHNFILEIGSSLPIDFPTPGVINLQAQLDEKQKQIETLKVEKASVERQVEDLNIELAVYKSIVGK